MQLNFETIIPKRSYQGKENLHHNGKDTPSSKKSKNQLILPKEILFQVMRFLTPHQIFTKLRPLSRTYLKMISQGFWHFYNERQSLNFNNLYEKKRFLIERRSKGQLFEVINRLSGQKYMLKIVDTFKSNANCQDGLQSSILREVVYLKSLPKHDNINQILEVHIQGHLVKLLYEWHPQTLKDRLKQSFSLQQIKDYMRQIVQGVDFLHSNRMLHRNIKPDNILINNGKVILTDLTLAKLETFPHQAYTPEDPKERERSNREVRRLWYRAPELLLRTSFYGSEIDVWSLGCLLAEMALGEPLFKGRSEIEHLFEVFALRGSPQQFDWDHLTDKPESRIQFPNWKQYSMDLSKLTLEEIKDLAGNRPNVLRQLTKLNEVLPKEGIDFIQYCLAIRPFDRPSLKQLSQHPFIADSLYRVPEISAFIPQFKDYINNQITYSVRATLVDWLIDVTTHFDLLDSSLHLAVTYLDMYLSIRSVEKKQLQLVGVTALKIAEQLSYLIKSVYNERSKEYYKQENCKSYSYITDNEYTAEEIIKMETEVCSSLNFQLNIKTTLHYYRVYSAQLKIDLQAQLIGEFYCDFFLMCYETLFIRPELLAWAYILLIGNHSPGVCDQPNESLTQTISTLQDSWGKFKTYPNTNALQAVYAKHNAIDPRNLSPQWPSQLVINSFVQL